MNCYTLTVNNHIICVGQVIYTGHHINEVISKMEQYLDKFEDQLFYVFNVSVWCRGTRINVLTLTNYQALQLKRNKRLKQYTINKLLLNYQEEAYVTNCFGRSPK